MGELEDLSNGVNLALNATLARLEQDLDEVKRLINAATREELANAVAYLSDAYQESVVSQCGDDRQRAFEVFKSTIASGAATGDVMSAQMRVMEQGGDSL